MKRTLTTLVIAAIAAGCAGSDPYSEYQNHNTGARGNLTFAPVDDQAVGETVSVTVSRSEVGTFDCATYPGFLTDHVECHLASPFVDLQSLVSARCEGDGCSAELETTGSVRVTGTRPGTFAVVVSARLTDGSAVEDETQVSFAQVDAIELRCIEAHRCPGPHAMLVGASYDLLATSSSLDHGTLAGPVAIVGIEPGGVIDASYRTDGPWGKRLNVRALRPGVATLRLRAGNLDRTLAVRVAGVDEVVAAEVWTTRNQVESQGYLADGTDILGERAPQRLSPFSPAFVPVWILKDGTFALGAAGRVTPVTAGLELRVVGSFDPNDLETMYFFVGGVDCRPGEGRVTARLGAVTLDWSFFQECE
jgi:hypothetical protein